MTHGARREVPRIRAVLAGLATIAILAGCTPGTDQDANPYAAEFAQARNEATTEAARKILEDDVITAAEYEQVQEASVQCMRDQGLVVTIEEEGGLTFELVGLNADSPQEEIDAMNAQIEEVRQECSKKFDLSALGLYWDVVQNPEKEDMLQAIAACMVRGGHRDKGYDKEAYSEELARYSITLKTAADGSDFEVEGDLSGQPLPPEMAACQENPKR